MHCEAQLLHMQLLHAAAWSLLIIRMCNLHKACASSSRSFPSNPHASPAVFTLRFKATQQRAESHVSHMQQPCTFIFNINILLALPAPSFRSCCRGSPLTSPSYPTA
jgi:hypothetical protein